MTNPTRQFLNPALLARLRALPLHARTAMIGSVSGKHRSPVKGSSLEFAQYRKYVPGDDTRRLDWRTWGRTDRFYIKEFEADTNLRLNLILDASGSMNFGPPGHTRLDYARQLAGSLAWLAARQGDAVGLWTVHPDTTHEIPCKRGPTHLGLVLDRIGETQASGETRLIPALHEAAEKVRQRSLTVILSDLFIPPAELKPALQHLRFRNHDTVILHLLDQAELDFNIDRPARFVDMEGTEHVLADPSLVTRQYREAIAQYLSELDTIVRDTGIDYHRIKLHENPEEVLARFLLNRTPKRGARS
ncbi:DUF58 domain-containing protein [Phragmitibacter flavus]|uniref:DUF58 domain-containing protein n=1 Tax=Phragmitibacter flavus TaxID=2576071 RepID=A0A5R8KFR4_9BACT|nr:DUF58 domain-containing protein [Phragmitibacter flavus]TLD71164.1 DUF58 domain-containing protein [Phragmitibacter flavus]